MRVLRKPQRLEAALFDDLAKITWRDAVVGRKHRDPELHHVPFSIIHAWWIIPRSLLRGGRTPSAPWQNPRAQPIAQFGGAPARVEHLHIDPKLPRDIPPTRIALERAQLDNSGAQ